MFFLRLVAVLTLVGVVVLVSGYLLTGRTWFRDAALKAGAFLLLFVALFFALILLERVLLPIL